MLSKKIQNKIMLKIIKVDLSEEEIELIKMNAKQMRLTTNQFVVLAIKLHANKEDELRRKAEHEDKTKWKIRKAFFYN